MKLSKSLQSSLHQCLTADIDDFRQLGNVHETKQGPAIHIDNGADVLAVGHLDWVHFNPSPKFRDNMILNCPQLDDRLGVWVLLHLLPELYPDLKYDVLLCDSEEIGQSTGQHYPGLQTKNYNWGFEFDRAGTDSVLYDYDEAEWRKEMESISPIGFGAFSDISSLEHVGCKFVNVGVGYHDQHTHECYANINETLSMAHSFAQWALANQERRFNHEPMAPGANWGSSWYDNPQEDNECHICNEPCDEDQMLCIRCQADCIAACTGDESIRYWDDEQDEYYFSK